MKKVIKWSVGIIFAVAFAFLYAHVDNMTFLYNQDIDTSEYVNTGILQNTKLSQSFVCEEAFLDGIQVKCSSVGNVENVSISYIIEEETTKIRVAEGVVEGIEIKNNKFNKIKFDRIENCKGKKYKITFEENGSDPINGVSFYFAEDLKSNKAFILGGEEIERYSLVVRTFSHRFDFETFGVVIIFLVYIAIFLKILYKLFK